MNGIWRALVGFNLGWLDLAAGQNLLINPGFEEVVNGQPRAWTAESWQTPSKLSMATGAPGGRAVCIDNTGAADRGAWRQQIAVPAPGFYVASARCRSEGDRATFGAGPVLRIIREGDRAASASAEPAAKWSEVRQVFYVKPETGTVTIELARVSSPGTVWWDDAAVRRATPAEVYQYVSSRLDAPPIGFQAPYSPADGGKVSVNPPAFVWLPVDGAADYAVEISRTPAFPRGRTIVQKSAISLQVLRRLLEPGKWYWRYGVLAQGASAPQYSRARVFDMPADAVKVPFPDVREVVRRISGSRPRAGILAGELAGVRERARGKMLWAVKNVVAAAEQAIGQPLLPEPARLPPPNDPRRGELYQKTFQTTRPFLRGMDVCAEAYLLTGEERFGQEARRRLMHVLSWDPNGSTSLPHNDEPGTELVRLCPRAYDFIYPLLTEAERQKAREVLAIRIPQVYAALRARPFESNPYESHAMDYYISDLTEACLRMAGDLPVQEMLEYVLLQMWAPFYPPYGGEDGGWSEGPSYWGWSTLNFLRIFRYVEQVTGAPVSQRAWFQNTLYYKLYDNPPYSRMSPFGDGQSGGPVMPDTMYYLGVILRNPYALWYAQVHPRPARPQGISAFMFPLGDLAPKPPTDLPQARLFADVGLAAMHSVLADSARNVQVLLRSSPYGSTSHAYADQNAFVLHAFGEPLAIASGYYDYYASPHHREWTWQTKAANCITVDGEGQQTRSPESKGRIVRFATNEYAHYAQGDARLAYPRRLKQFDRHVIFLRPHGNDEAMVVIVDDLESEKPARFEWWLHSLEEMKIDQPSETVYIQRGAARLKVQFLMPEDLRFEQKDGFPVMPLGRYPTQWHLTAHADPPAVSRRFITVLLPYRTGAEASLPSVHLLNGQRCSGVELRTAAARHVVLVHDTASQGTMRAAGLRSDAALYAAGFDTQGSYR
jgi:hypothetical protein